MKNHLGTIVTLLAVVGIIFSGAALAQVTGQSESSGFSPPPQNRLRTWSTQACRPFFGQGSP